MQTATAQRGISFTGFLLLIVGLAVVATFSMRMIPAYIENGKIQHTLEEIVRDQTLQVMTSDEIREAFNRRAHTMNDVSVVTSSDLDITRAGGLLKLSISYNKKIPLYGNLSLFLEFNPMAEQ